MKMAMHKAAPQQELEWICRMVRLPEKGVRRMNSFVPKNKMSKKKRRAMDAEKRVQWTVPPVTKVVPNKKKAEQNRKLRPGREDAGWSFSYILSKKTQICHNMQNNFRIIG